MSDKMTDWYITGNRWTLCHLISNVLGAARAELYTGEIVTGRARRGLYGWLIDAS